MQTDPADYCRRLTQESGSSFYYPLLFLPKKKREALYAIYAFCRHSDDIVDESRDPVEARKNLDAWREELERAYGGTPHHPISRQLQNMLPDYSIPKNYFEQLILGMEMDLLPRRYENFEELYLYCYRVASVVGLACIEVFGYSHPQVKEYAIAQGVAFQLTNIVRDLREDMERDRIYLPQDEMKRFGYSEADLFRMDYNDAFIALMRHQCERAKGYYRKAASLLWKPDRPNLVVSEIMRSIYEGILLKIEANRYNVFQTRISLTASRKLFLALSTWWACRNPGPR
jgi:phytoene synthase